MSYRNGVSGLAAGVSAELAAGVSARLAVLERAARGLRAPGQLSQIREDLVSIVGMWHRLLAAHRPDAQGRCPQCRCWWRRRRWPCEVWSSAHTVLLAMEASAGAPPPAETARGALPPRGAVAAGELTIRRRPGRDGDG